jgi:hypothetical protein
VMMGPPMLGVPQPMEIGTGARSRVVPNVTCQRTLPVERSIACSWPHGGGVHGPPSGEITTSRIIP